MVDKYFKRLFTILNYNHVKFHLCCNVSDGVIFAQMDNLLFLVQLMVFNMGLMSISHDWNASNIDI